MRILVYPHDLNMGGSQTNAIELAAAVSRLGHECIIFGPRGTLCTRIEELGLEFIESPDPGRRPSLRVARTLREIVRSREIDVIHGYEWPPGLEGAMAAEAIADVAAVCTIMSMAVAPFLPHRMPLIVGTQQICAVEQMKGRLNVHLIEPPVDLTHNGPVDHASVQRFRGEWQLDDHIPTVVCVSRLVPELKSEGILTAIETAGALAETTPFQLVIVGDGRAREAMEIAAERANSRAGRRVVVFTGELSDPRAAYAAADLVLGMGGSALRALAFAKPLIVQGERGFFRTLTPATVDQFRWQGWYGVGEGAHHGDRGLRAELAGLLTDPVRRRELGDFGRQVVEEVSLERAAHRQVTIYRDAVAGRAVQKRQIGDAARSFIGYVGYYIGQRAARWRGTRRADDFNARPVASHAVPAAGSAMPRADDGPILYFPGVGWDTLAGTDRHLALALAKDRQVIWVDTPHSVLRRRDRVLPHISHPEAHIVRLRASVLAGVQQPVLRDVANRRRAQVARRYLARNGLQPYAVIASTTAPMLPLLGDVTGTRVYYATDDFVTAGKLWGVSENYLTRSREKNLRAADLVLAVTDELGRHLQRSVSVPRSLPNGADLSRFAGIDEVRPAPIDLPRPVAGVVGQFNSRTDLDYLEAVQQRGVSLLLVGPRWFASDADAERFDRLIALPGVKWIDAIPRDLLAPYLRALDVGLTPYRDSMFNRRSYPLKTVEYLAAGLPVVATNVAPTSGLATQYVRLADDVTAFCESVDHVVGAQWDAAIIRRSVESESWEARAAQLATWLRQEDR